MDLYFLRRLFGFSFLSVVLLLPLAGLAQRMPSTLPNQQTQTEPDPGISANLMVMVHDESGHPSDAIALVSISGVGGGMLNQGTTNAGQVEFDGLVPGMYTIKVSAGGYEDSVQTVNVNGGLVIAQIQMRLIGEAKAEGQRPPGLPILSPKGQKLAKEVWKNLQEKKLDSAHAGLEELYKLAPANPDVTYLYGVYEIQARDLAQAKSYWQKTLEIYPRHMGALLQLSQMALQENRPGEAIPWLNTAMDAAPTAWRPHALMSQAFFEQRQYPDSVKEADKALALGHKEASPVHPLLARALAAEGNKERAIQVLRNYLRDHPENTGAQKMLDTFEAPASKAPNSAGSQAPPPGT